MKMQEIKEDDLFHFFELFINHLGSYDFNKCNIKGKIQLNEAGDYLLITDKVKGKIIKQIIKKGLNYIEVA